MAKSFESLDSQNQDEERFPRKRIEREIADELSIPELNKVADRENDLITGGNAMIMEGEVNFDYEQHRWTGEAGSAYEVGQRELEEIRTKYRTELPLFRLKSLLRCREAKLFWPYERYSEEVYQPEVIEKFADKLDERERKELLGFIHENLAIPLAKLQDFKHISVAAAAEGGPDYAPYGLLKAEYTQEYIDKCEHHLGCLNALLPVLPEATKEVNERLVEELQKFLNWIIENRPESKIK